MRTIQQARANLSASVAVIPGRYREGVESADWATPAGSDAAEQMWATKTQEAARNKTRQKAVKAVGNEVWRRNSVDNVAAVIGTRIDQSLDKYETRFGPILSAMETAAQALPARTADFRTNIQNRVTPVVEAAKRASGRLNS